MTDVLTPPSAQTAGHAANRAAALAQALTAAEPSVVLCQAWLLQNIIAADRGRSPLSPRNRKVHVIEHRRLLQLAAAQHWTLPDLPEQATLILVARPELDLLDANSQTELLRMYRRWLFHARVELQTRQSLPEGATTSAALQERIEAIGRTGFEEASFVLQRERRLPYNASFREAYVHFAAFFLELHHFRPDLLAVYFPALAAVAPRVLAALGRDVDADALLGQSQPAGVDESPATNGQFNIQTTQHANGDLPPRLAPTRSPTRIFPTPIRDSQRVRLLADADRAASLGNHVRAALDRRAALAGGLLEGAARSESPDLEALLSRLAAALELDANTLESWRLILLALLQDAQKGWWNADGRLLYDLQKICLHAEREIYSVGVVDWLLQGCQRPLCRPQTHQRIVLICKSLRAASGRAPHTRLLPDQQRELLHLLHGSLHHTEAGLRERLRAGVAAALVAGGLVPRDACERLAAHKVAEDLLDVLVHRGYLTLGAVRDAISANQLKFEDLHSVREGLIGDPLFRVDHHLSLALDGVYHRGEIYRRIFQKGSSWAFATRIGRRMTRTVLMPLGGSFILIEGFDHTLFLLFRLVTGMHWWRISQFEDYKRSDLGLVLNLPFVIVALMILGMVNSPAFRDTTLRVLSRIGRGLGWLMFDVPRWIFSRRGVQAFLDSRATRLVFRYGIKPLPLAACALLIHDRPGVHWATFAAAFIVVNFLMNSRAGRAFEHIAAHWLRVFAARVTSDILGSLFSGVMHFFARLLEDFDRMLYAVDEWLRFREGQPRSSLALKAVLGVFWFYIAYFARFAVNLLVEPQVNPIKHFPVVTVSHKIVLPTVGLLAQAIQSLGVGVGRARTLAAAIVTTTPGVFGFLAWELRSNWKLYRANRHENLEPVAVGSHGETMARLLRPGFHSGTLPKLFAKMRRVRAAAKKTDDATDAFASAREHLAEAVGNFINRQFLGLVNANPAFQLTPVGLAGVVLGPTRVEVLLACPAIGEEKLTLFFEQRAGWIVSGFAQAGWLPRLAPDPLRLFAAAVLGLYKLANVQIVKERIDRQFAPHAVTFCLSKDAITVFLDGRFEAPITGPLREGQEVEGLPKEAVRFDAMPLLLSRSVVRWNDWVRVWSEPDVSLPAAFPDPHQVLPPTARDEVTLESRSLTAASAAG